MMVDGETEIVPGAGLGVETVTVMPVDVLLTTLTMTGPVIALEGTVA